jgi:UDP-N-acetylmuramoylalanine-D-glutamate ligase
LNFTVDILFLGGKDRHSDFTGLASVLAEHTPRAIVLLPENGQKIHSVLVEHIPSTALPTFYAASTMQDAVAFCYTFKQSLAHSTHIPRVLLSTASPSYGLFKNFEDKGDQFSAAIYALSNSAQD